jgi:hypothetical protein
MENQNLIKRYFNDFEIQIKSQVNSILISINKLNSYNIYKSNFKIEFLQSFKLLSSFDTINNIVQFIFSLIDEKNINIQEDQNNLILILISKLEKCSNVELNLTKVDIISKEIIELLINKTEKLKEENKLLKESFGNEIKKLNENIELLKIENLNKEKKISSNENEINELKMKIQKLEENKKFPDLKYVNCIKAHKSYVNSVSIFPSGKIISVSGDKSIKIFDTNLNVIDKILNSHEQGIFYIDVIDENTFVTCTNDLIKIWNKKENIFVVKNTIENAHNEEILKVIHFSNGNLISCSRDKTIKLWGKNNNGYENITILCHSDRINSILLLEDKNLLISSGLDGTNFWNINNYEKIFYLKETYCGWNEGLKRIDEDKIIIKGKDTNLLKIISISQKKVVLNVNNPFQCNSICVIKEKGIVLIGGRSKDIRVYRVDTFECIQTIKDAHENDIRGFTQIKDGLVASFSKDKFIKIWSY